ncbi:MAG: hypothetical protein H7329_07180 [Opitutaceae bacterium]|nr:hypothetical protein [Cytophagales bacterium]
MKNKRKTLEQEVAEAKFKLKAELESLESTRKLILEQNKRLDSSDLKTLK